MCFGLPSRAWCPDQLDLALDRGIYNRNACAQLRRVFELRALDRRLQHPNRLIVDPKWHRKRMPVPAAMRKREARRVGEAVRRSVHDLGNHRQRAHRPRSHAWNEQQFGEGSNVQSQRDASTHFLDAPGEGGGAHSGLPPQTVFGAFAKSIPMCNRILESDSMNNVLKRPFFRQVERWLVSLVMAAMAFVIEKALLRAIRRGEAKPLPHDESSAETIFSAGAERRRSAQR
jgi:hypothetical protein